MNRNQEKNFFSKIRETVSKDITIILILAPGSVFQFYISINQISSANHELGLLNLGFAMILLGATNKAKTFNRKASLLWDKENKESEYTYGIEYTGFFLITLAALSSA